MISCSPRSVCSFAAAILIPAIGLAQKPVPAATPAAPPAKATPSPATSAAFPTEGGRLKVPAVPETMVRQFFAILEKGNIEDAYAKLTEGSQIGELTEQSALLRQKTAEAIEAYGKIEGFERIGTEWAGKHLIRLTYLSLGEKLPLRWRFYFYERSNKWRLVDIRVDDSITDLFGENGDDVGTP